MRRLTRRDDRGLAAIMVVIALPALLMMGSLVFDGARGLLAVRQTQNAADAGALASATDCAKNISGTNLSPYANGTNLSTTGCGTGSTTAKASKTIQATFAIAGGPWTVTRSATAIWGSINSATTIPAVISSCAFQEAVPGGIPSSGQGQQVIVPIDDGSVNTDPNCPGRPPGNFGWLTRSSSTSCSVTTTLDPVTGLYTAQGDNGNGTGLPYDCINGTDGGGLNSEVLIPIYTTRQWTGNNVTYTISGYADFHITGWNLSHGTPQSAPTPGAPTCPKQSKNCIQGYFVKFVTGQDSTGTSTNYGAITVKLSS